MVSDTIPLILSHCFGSDLFQLSMQTSTLIHHYNYNKTKQLFVLEMCLWYKN